MYLDFNESEGQILARCLADAIQFEIKTGTRDEWQALSEEARESLENMDLTHCHFSERIALVVQKTMIEYKKRSSVVYTNPDDIRCFINRLLLEAINDPDVQLEWHQNQVERLAYNRRFLLSRIKGLETGASLEPGAKKIAAQFKHEFRRLHSNVEAFSVSPDLASAYKKIDNALEEITAIGQAIASKRSVEHIQERLAKVRGFFNVSAVREALLAYRLETSCAGGFCHFFTFEDSRDKATIRELKKILKAGKSAEEETREVQKIISDFEKNQVNTNSILFTALLEQGLLKRPKKNMSSLAQPLLVLPSEENDSFQL